MKEIGVENNNSKELEEETEEEKTEEKKTEDRDFIWSSLLHEIRYHAIGPRRRSESHIYVTCKSFLSKIAESAFNTHNLGLWEYLACDKHYSK